MIREHNQVENCDITDLRCNFWSPNFDKKWDSGKKSKPIYGYDKELSCCRKEPTAKQKEEQRQQENIKKLSKLSDAQMSKLLKMLDDGIKGENNEKEN